MDDKKKAAAEIRKLIDAYPAKIEFRHRLATFYEADGDTEEAQKVYAEILEVNPNDPVAQLAVKKKEKGSSEAQFLESLKPQFQNSTVSIDAKVKELAPYLNVFSETGKEDVKSALFELADLMQNAHPSDPKAWSLAGDIYYLAGNNQEAYSRYQRCIQLSPNVFSVWENSLRILYENGDFETLYSEAEKAMDAFPNQAISYYFFAQGAIGTDKSREAIPVLNQAVIMSGRNPGLQLDIEALLIHAYNLSGQFEAALKQADKALSHGGDKHPVVLEYTGDVYFNSNNKSKAREYWEKAKAIRSTPELIRKLTENKI
jgi:tetratricopeptide (TPR) repeat protein